MTNQHGIVANGQERIRQSEQYRKAEQSIRAKYAQMFTERSKRLGLFARMGLRVGLWRQMRQELRQRSPNRGNYFIA